MARVLPFQGYRYNLEKIGDPAAVVSPPYDVIPHDFRRALHQQHPYNVVRLILGEDRTGDGEAENRYVRAHRYFHEWEQTGMLVRESHPVFYVYEQAYQWKRGERRVRTGLIGAVGLEDYNARIIFPHEQTFPGPKADRLRLMQALPVNLEQIFCFYPGSPEPIRSRLLEVTRTAPLCDFGDAPGVRHRLWVLQDAEAIRDLVMAFRERPLFIADGHHRYETALTFQKEMEHIDVRGGPDKAYNFVMMTLVSIGDEGLTILPTHRLIQATRDRSWTEILRSLKPHFHCDGRVIREGEGIKIYFEEMEDRGRQAHVFGLYTGGDTFTILTLKDPGVLKGLAESGRSFGGQPLDVVVLEHLVFRRLLKIEDAEVIRYTHDDQLALAEVRQGRAAAAFFVNPTPVSRITEIVSAGERLPPKTTFFYPKLASGLVFFKVDRSEILNVPTEV
ncbi:MAG: DUF1015 domain-containing protein [Candidatus Methylomirabilales bacterium]